MTSQITGGCYTICNRQERPRKIGPEFQIRKGINVKVYVHKEGFEIWITGDANHFIFHEFVHDCKYFSAESIPR